MISYLRETASLKNEPHASKVLVWQ